MLLNSETWVNMTQKNLEDFEIMDKILLQSILGAPSKTPIPALYPYKIPNNVQKTYVPPSYTKS